MNYNTKKWIYIIIFILSISRIFNLCGSKINNIEKFTEIDSKIFTKIANLININKRDTLADVDNISLQDHFGDLDTELSILELNRKLIQKDLFVTKNTKVSDLKNLLMIKDISDDLENGISEFRKIFLQLMKIINFSKCGDEGFINYCKKGIIVTKTEKFSNLKKEIRHFTKYGEFREDFGDSEIKTDFRKLSIKEAIDRFVENDNKILANLFSKFKLKYKREYNNYNKKDLYKLAVIFIKDIKVLIKNIKETKGKKDRDSRSLRRDSIKKFIPSRNLFYQIKHHFKILSIYLLFNKFIKNEKDNVQANICCAPTKFDNKKVNYCANLSSEAKNSVPRVYGFSRYGYIKDSKCKSESFFEQDLEEKLDLVLRKNNSLKSKMLNLFLNNKILNENKDNKSYKLKNIDLDHIKKLQKILEKSDFNMYEEESDLFEEEMKEKGLETKSEDKTLLEDRLKVKFIKDAKIRSQTARKIIADTEKINKKIKLKNIKEKKEIKRLLLLEEERERKLKDDRDKRMEQAKKLVKISNERVRQKIKEMEKKFKKDRLLRQEQNLAKTEELKKVVTKIKKQKKKLLNERVSTYLKAKNLEQERLLEERRQDRIRINQEVKQLKAKRAEEKRKADLEAEEKLLKIRKDLKEKLKRDKFLVEESALRVRRAREKLLKETKEKLKEKQRQRRLLLEEEKAARMNAIKLMEKRQEKLLKQKRLLIEEEDIRRKREIEKRLRIKRQEITLKQEEERKKELENIRLRNLENERLRLAQQEARIEASRKKEEERLAEIKRRQEDIKNRKKESASVDAALLNKLYEDNKKCSKHTDCADLKNDKDGNKKYRAFCLKDKKTNVKRCFRICKKKSDCDSLGQRCSRFRCIKKNN